MLVQTSICCQQSIHVHLACGPKVRRVRGPERPIQNQHQISEGTQGTHYVIKACLTLDPGEIISRDSTCRMASAQQTHLNSVPAYGMPASASDMWRTNATTRYVPPCRSWFKVCSMPAWTHRYSFLHHPSIHQRRHQFCLFHLCSALVVSLLCVAIISLPASACNSHICSQ